jgi:hypothetical protein
MDRIGDLPPSLSLYLQLSEPTNSFRAPPIPSCQTENKKFPAVNQIVTATGTATPLWVGSRVEPMVNDFISLSLSLSLSFLLTYFCMASLIVLLHHIILVLTLLAGSFSKTGYLIKLELGYWKRSESSSRRHACPSLNPVPVCVRARHVRFQACATLNPRTCSRKSDSSTCRY